MLAVDPGVMVFLLVVLAEQTVEANHQSVVGPK